MLNALGGLSYSYIPIRKIELPLSRDAPRKETIRKAERYSIWGCLLCSPPKATLMLVFQCENPSALSEMTTECMTLPFLTR